ncbi:protease [Sphingobacterium alkalisoli]|uniref:Protease n=1 Tax=Sphingobacterium alkalisoli TaxID=1874115 RepID=A0A4U0H349_9SPHI|nr:protease [Sphingobacterium alkalisoli]TJY65948.1 protease [Sphingobacterium alkalisoli]
MKKTLFLASTFLLSLLSSCNMSARNNEKTSVDSTATIKQTSSNDTSLIVQMITAPTFTVNSPVEMEFRVYNPTDSVKKFCKWHTPFEKPFMSKYLDITLNTGEEVSYLGAMAKRMMPPPEDSYLSVNPLDSLLVTIDLTKGYDLKKPGTYTLKYNSEKISGLVVQDSISFTIN